MFILVFMSLRRRLTRVRIDTPSLNMLRTPVPTMIIRMLPVSLDDSLMILIDNNNKINRKNGSMIQNLNKNK